MQDTEDQNIKVSSIVSFDIIDAISGKPIIVKNLTDPITIHIPKTISGNLNGTFQCKHRITSTQGGVANTWGEEGCTCDLETENYVICKTNHLTEF